MVIKLTELELNGECAPSAWKELVLSSLRNEEKRLLLECRAQTEPSFDVCTPHTSSIRNRCVCVCVFAAELVGEILVTDKHISELLTCSVDEDPGGASLLIFHVLQIIFHFVHSPKKKDQIN